MKPQSQSPGARLPRVGQEKRSTWTGGIVPHRRKGSPWASHRHIAARRASRSSACPSTPRVRGVDDWAFHKGHRYGTILVDLERRQPRDLLPEREPATLVVWLKAHPGVEVITRDRSSPYAEAAREGAPQAVQVADRWHLRKNLREAAQRCLTRQHASVEQATTHVAQQQLLEYTTTAGAVSILSSRSAKDLQQNRAKR
jgi:transposase